MKQQVSNRQIFFIIFITLSAFSIQDITKTMAKTAGTGAWVPLLIAAICFSVFVFIIVYLGLLFKGKTLFEYSILLVGKPVSYCFAFIYTAYFLCIYSSILRSCAGVLRLELLKLTPLYATMFVLVLLSIYAVSKGITNIGRMVEFFGIILIITIIAFAIQMYIFGDKLNIFPLFEAENINAYMSALPLTIGSFLGIEVLTIVALSKKNEKKAGLSAVVGVIAVLIFYLLVVYLTYMLLGVEDSKNYKDSLFVGIRLLNIDILQFLKRFDMVAFLVWMFIMFCTLIIVFYALTEYTKKIFHKAHSNIVLIVIGTISYILALLIPSYDVALLLFNSIAMYFGLIPAFIIPLFLLIVAKVKKY